MSITATRNEALGSSLSRIEEMLAKAREASGRRQTGATTTAPAAQQPMQSVPAADDVDQAYGMTMNLLGGGLHHNADATRTGHALDPERVAKLLEL
ncbi:hypothetical protein Dde_0288 [Oleidesulfovibrio alaskensis G20]|jgi:hypothetical protein|uniref:Uncharacterized protein n=1 Tax=Oleidesulfovibrio alaskensis (strain ATCC BAA-1058 / DSM 17464 / G20) TaxID=207559 RepID=Q316Q7_OLEA2|nr:hypothetical protein [Oleidesulfovibrio alaskensis]ABB37089.1 hypothetical protein Dde_0288 [Oleidesulfovibrio alaskensis G20]MBG0772970.1 hypothetical protein [Oleidesulfovibrio alaskensis]